MNQKYLECLLQKTLRIISRNWKMSRKKSSRLDQEIEIKHKNEYANDFLKDCYLPSMNHILKPMSKSSLKSKLKNMSTSI